MYFLLRQLFRPLIIIWKGPEMSVSIVFYYRSSHAHKTLPFTHARTRTQSEVACRACKTYYSRSCLLPDYSSSTLVSTTLSCPVVESWVGNNTLDSRIGLQPFLRTRWYPALVPCSTTAVEADFGVRPKVRQYTRQVLKRTESLIVPKTLHTQALGSADAAEK